MLPPTKNSRAATAARYAPTSTIAEARRRRVRGTKGRTRGNAVAVFAVKLCRRALPPPRLANSARKVLFYFCSFLMIGFTRGVAGERQWRIDWSLRSTLSWKRG